MNETFDSKSIDFGWFVEGKLFEHVRDIVRRPDRLQCRCPLCGDSAKNKRLKRFWYYKKTVSCICWNAGCVCSGKGLPILKVLSLITGQTISELKFEYLKSLNKPKQKIQKEEIPEPLPKQKVELKNSWVPIDDKIQGYIDKRKIMSAPYCPENWKFYFDKKTKRLVIPWYIHNKMVTYQLRAIFKNQSPKYLFPFGIEKPIFGIDKIDESFEYIFGLEGSFDSIFVKNGVAIGGVTPTVTQIETVEKTLCNFVHFFDNQHHDSTSLEKTIRLAEKNPKAKMFVWPKEIKEKDVNEYIMKHNDNPFNDIDFLQSHVMSGLKAKLYLYK